MTDHPAPAAKGLSSGGAWDGAGDASLVHVEALPSGGTLECVLDQDKVFVDTEGRLGLHAGVSGRQKLGS